jgi:hypothetical protein
MIAAGGIAAFLVAEGTVAAMLLTGRWRISTAPAPKPAAAEPAAAPVPSSVKASAL